MNYELNKTKANYAKVPFFFRVILIYRSLKAIFQYFASNEVEIDIDKICFSIIIIIGTIKKNFSLNILHSDFRKFRNIEIFTTL